MKRTAEQVLPLALNAFDWGGTLVGAVRYGFGHINDTFCVYVQNDLGDCIRYILQRINTDTFQNPVALMENICGVTKYLQQIIAANGGDVTRETMRVLPTKDGASFFAESSDNTWRVYPFVEDTVCLQKVEQPQQFYESAWAFGNFQKLLTDYPAATLHETIENFHNTTRRYENFERALSADSCNRAKEVSKEIEFVKARKQECDYLVNLLSQEKLPLRVTHNDTKLNNILLDKATGKGVCVIDLDTVMPGLAAYDYGDSIRFGANDCAEDETDLNKVNFSLPLFETFTQGYLEAAGDALTPLEKETLPWGAKLATLECGIRFLTDYLEGDHYFKTHRPGHNLDRCRTQFKLVQDMERDFEQMGTIVQKYC